MSSTNVCFALVYAAKNIGSIEDPSLDLLKISPAHVRHKCVLRARFPYFAYIPVLRASIWDVSEGIEGLFTTTGLSLYKQFIILKVIS